MPAVKKSAISPTPLLMAACLGLAGCYNPSTQSGASGNAVLSQSAQTPLETGTIGTATTLQDANPVETPRNAQNAGQNTEQNTDALALGRTAPVKSDIAITPGKTFSPDPGVICSNTHKPGEAKKGLCYDRHGIGMGLTREYYGLQAMNEALELSEKSGFDYDFFALSDGVVCDAKRERCWFARSGGKDKPPAPLHTKILFGPLPWEKV